MLFKAHCSTPAGLAAWLTKDEESAAARYLTPTWVQWLSAKVALAITSKGGPGDPKKKLMVFAPPRHGKSEQTSKWTPVWFLNLRPYGRVMFGTYSAEFAKDWGRKVRNTLELYKDQLSAQLSEDSQSVHSWHTTAGGGMMAQGIGGAFTGRGGDLLICDDPYKNLQDANSAVYREAVWSWWTSAFMTRCEPGATVILTLTRWHVDDLAGRILADPEQAKEWEVISIPALAEPGDPLGRPLGAALWPERKNRETLLKEQVAVGSYVWDALYRQQPPDLNGGNVYYGFAHGEWPHSGNIDDDAGLVAGVPVDLSIDFNKRPGSHALIGQYLQENDTATVLHELHTPQGVAKHITLAFVDWWKEQTVPLPWVNLYGDASGGSGSMTDGESAWQTVISILQANGIDHSFRVPKANPGVFDRVEAMNAAMVNVTGERRYRINSSCTRLIRDLQKVAWDNGKIDKSNTDLSHASDADGYRIAKLMPVGTTEIVNLASSSDHNASSMPGKTAGNDDDPEYDNDAE